MVCVLFGDLTATLWYVFFSVCCARLCGVCTLRGVECDCIVCVLFGVLRVTVWCVYFSVC